MHDPAWEKEQPSPQLLLQHSLMMMIGGMDAAEADKKPGRATTDWQQGRRQERQVLINSSLSISLPCLVHEI